jgi:hypothetical protein
MTPDGPAIAAYWAHRATSEARAAALFERLLLDLRRAGAEDVVLDLAERAIADERRHAAKCLEVAAHYDSLAVAPSDAAHVAPDGHAEEEEPELHGAMHAAAFCCIQESIACAWLDGCLRRAREPVVREALHAMLSDETRHARLGWAHLASSRVSPATRARVATALPDLLRSCVASWLDPQVSRLAIDAPEHGVPYPDATRRLVLAAVEEVVRPGFASLGMAG